MQEEEIQDVSRDGNRGQEAEGRGVKEVPQEILETSRRNQVCCVCKSGKIVFENRGKDTITVYGRNGVRQVHHNVYRCNNRHGEGCRVGYYHGYISYQGHRIYENDAIEQEVLVTTHQSAFDVEYLVEVKYRVQIGHTAYEAESKIFNRFHNRTLISDTLQKRVDLDPRRLIHACKMFNHLEFGSRYGIKNYQVIYNDDIDKTILLNDQKYDEAFEERWTIGHKCNVPGCDTCLVVDGGCKPHRPTCAAKLSGVKVFVLILLCLLLMLLFLLLILLFLLLILLFLLLILFFLLVLLIFRLSRCLM